MGYFLYQLIPPRPSFDRDMSEAEEDVHGLGRADPAVTSAVARFEVCAMPGAIAAARMIPR